MEGSGCPHRRLAGETQRVPGARSSPTSPQIYWLKAKINKHKRGGGGGWAQLGRVSAGTELPEERAGAPVTSRGCAGLTKATFLTQEGEQRRH